MLAHNEWSWDFTPFPWKLQVVRVPPPSIREVVDTTGAGDAFLGGLIVGVLCDMLCVRSLVHFPRDY